MIHAGWQRAILRSPGGVNVLGNTFVRIEGVNRTCTERQIEKKETKDREGFAGPVKTAKNYLPHVDLEKHHVLWHPVH